MVKKYILVSEPNLKGKELNYVMDAVKSTWISSKGKYIDMFEKMFAEYVGVDYATSVSNGTVALHLALLAHDISGNVIVPNCTFAAVSFAVKYINGNIIYCEINFLAKTLFK